MPDLPHAHESARVAASSSWPHYDASTPIAVFLGPSLAREQASARLRANYYPPARMGDIYRLIGTGVRIIVLIDGLFHVAPAVWQREIMDALREGIHVIGAASMGALRAAELYPFGMRGVGTIFEWYRDGLIDGDDDVALLHADADSEYRTFSQPLVNIRYRLQHAVEQGELEPGQMKELLAAVKQTPFMRRTHAGLLMSPAAQALPSSVLGRLRAVLDDSSLDLKARDAQRALEHAATLVDEHAPARTPMSLEVPPKPSRFYLGTRAGARALVRERKLVACTSLWHALDGRTGLRWSILAGAARRFYLASFAEQRRVECPSAYSEGFSRRWAVDHDILDRDSWLRANGLTLRELHELLARRATMEWMLERGPQAFDLDLGSFAGLALPSEEIDVGALGSIRSAELVFLRAWAWESGISCPREEVEHFRDRFEHSAPQLLGAGDPAVVDARVSELALCEWLVRKQPYFFGYTSWSPLAELVQELRLTGAASNILTLEHGT